MLEFCEETHTYTLDGRVVPSCTQVIHAIAPYRQSGEAVERAANFGTALHRTLELLDRGMLGDYDPQLEPWIAGWKRFLADLPEIMKRCRMFVVDIKSGVPTPTWNLQLGGYSILAETAIGDTPQIEERFYHKSGFAGTIDRIYLGNGSKNKYACVQLPGNGDYKLHECNDIGMQKVMFLSFLNVTKWLTKNKLLNQEAK